MSGAQPFGAGEVDLWATASSYNGAAPHFVPRNRYSVRRATGTTRFQDMLACVYRSCSIRPI